MEKSAIVYILQSRKKSERKIQLKHILYINDSLVALFFLDKTQLFCGKKREESVQMKSQRSSQIEFLRKNPSQNCVKEMQLIK